MSTPSVDPSARVQVYPTPVASPGQCGMCGKAEHPRGFVDIRMDFEYYGVLYFCADCAGDIASAVGFFSPQDLSNLRDRVERQDAELVILREAVLGLESEVDGLLKHAERVGRPSRVSRDTVSDPVFSPEPSPGEGSPAPVEDVSEPAGPAPEPAGTGAPADGSPDESGDKPGRNDLLNVDAADALLGLDEPKNP